MVVYSELVDTIIVSKGNGMNNETTTQKEMKMYIIIETNDSSEPRAFGTFKTEEEANAALEQRKKIMTKSDWNGVEDMVVVGIWNVN